MKVGKRLIGDPIVDFSIFINFGFVDSYDMRSDAAFLKLNFNLENS